MSLEAARDEAIAGAREIMSEQIRQGERPDYNSRCEITNDDGYLVLTISFHEALSPRS
jgi:hypothetical protein